MITSLAINWFQSHKKSLLEFSPGLNIIVGSSDSGKSSLIRALLWVLNNRPAGDTIKNWKAQERDKVQVTVNFPEHCVQKERIKSKSKYIVDGVEFEALKQDVPEEVSCAAHLTDCNIQTQHEPYFLLNETPGEVARRLNEIVGLDIIDTIFRNLDHRIRSVSNTSKVHTDAIEALESDLKSLAHVDMLYEETLALEQKFLAADAIKLGIEQLQALVNQIIEVQTSIEKQTAPLEAEPFVLLLLAEIKEYKQAEKELTELTKLVDELSGLNGKIFIEREWLECTPLCKSLLSQVSEYQITERNLINLQRLVNQQLQDVIDDIDKEGYSLQAYKEEYADLLKKTKVCPICNSKINDKIISEVVANL